ncbi:MAG: cysteine desulfurase [Bacteroidales bacterium]|nr:cysteine desulfurase [Bacteroidales bacterium]
MSNITQHIYADNAATTPLNSKAYEAMLPYLMVDYGNASQPYAFARNPKKALKEARAEIAECIGALPEEIFFTSGGTESNNWVIQGAIKQDKPIVTSAIEHHSVLEPCALTDNVVFLPVDKEGVVQSKQLENILGDNKYGITSVMFANNEIGTIEPIDELTSIAHQHNWLFHTDAVQAIGHVPIDVHEIDVDMLSASAHKFNGPKGIGFLYIKKGTQWPSLLLGGSQESNHRAGTENVASIVGMAIALQENVKSLDNNTKHISHLEDLLLISLKDSGIRFRRNGCQKHIPGNISISFPKNDGEAILHRLDLMGISVSTGSACDSTRNQISHVLKAIGLEETYAKGTIRITLSHHNTEQEVQTIVSALKKIMGERL